MKKYLIASLYIVAEIVLYAIYSDQQASFHWFTHFLVGGSVALLGFCIWIMTTHRSVGWPLLWVYLAHIFAMVPDFLYNYAHIPHKPWMDVFMGHLSSHFIPGRNWTWYVVFMLTLGIYLALAQKYVNASDKSSQTSSA